MNNKPKYDGKVYKLRGLDLGIYSDEKGDMYAGETCSCGGCFNNKYKLEENDVVVSFKHLKIYSNSHIRKIKLVSMSFNIGENVILDSVRFEAHQSAIDFYCGSQLYDNYGIDGGKSFAQGLIKELEKDNTNFESCIELPNAAKENNKV